MTASDFTAFYPQFAGFSPAVVLSTYVAQANARFSSFVAEDAEEARRLFVAHRLTLYARTALPEGTAPSRAAIASAGESQQRVASRRVGEVSVTYASGSASSVSSVDTDLADLTQTAFGLQLLSLLRLYRFPRYVP